MDEEDRMILENIEEYVNEENKIVTYKWLSFTLSIHVNKSISLLEEYVKQMESESGIDVIYFVGGEKKSGSYLSFTYYLARQNSLDDVKKKFEKVTACHIYSIQKSKIKTADVLYSTDVDIVDEALPHINKFSAIQCELATKTERPRNIPSFNTTNHFQSEQRSENKEAKKEETKKSSATETRKESPPLTFFGKKSSGKKTDQKPNQKSASAEKKGEEKNSEKLNPKKTSIAESFTKSKGKSDNNKKHSDDDTMNQSDSCKKKSDDDTMSQSDSCKKHSDDDTMNHSDSSKKHSDIDTMDQSASSKKHSNNGTKDQNESVTNVDDKKENENAQKVKESIQKEKESTKNNDTDSQQRHNDKSKKRKAVVDDSESEDDFENFVAKNKDPLSKSETNKTPKQDIKKKSKEGEEEEDVDVVAPTPEPAERCKPKTKRRKKDEGNLKETKQKNIKDTKSDSVSGNQEDCDVSSPVDSTNQLQTNKSTSNGVKRRGRRKVLTSKQFENEEGFMVTRKSYESESFSEESDVEMSEEKMKTLSHEKKQEIKTKKTVYELEKKTKKHMNKRKHQASLTTFFKKK